MPTEPTCNLCDQPNYITIEELGATFPLCRNHWEGMKSRMETFAEEQLFDVRQRNSKQRAWLRKMERQQKRGKLP